LGEASTGCRGQLLVGEDGADERGARPSNGAPEVLSVDEQNADGTPGTESTYDGEVYRPVTLFASQATSAMSRAASR